jgi:hypothetical protein
VWLVGATLEQREGLELDRDKRNARWAFVRGNRLESLPRWFFPEQPAPFAAEVMHLVGRSGVAAYALAIAALVGGFAVRATAAARLRFQGRRTHETQDEGAASARERRSPRSLAVSWLAMDVLLGAWLVAAALVTTRLYHQLPHILDAVSYTFQAGLFASGQLALGAPPLAPAFKGPFEVLWQGRLFSQYPPGAPAAYALGRLLSLEWLVGPLACLAMLAATAWTARTLFGRFCGLVVLGLGVLSPFVLFQAGSYLSHPVAGGLLGLALASFVLAERGARLRWYAMSAALLGAGLLVREVASVLFAIPLGVRLVSRRRWRAAAAMVGCGLPFVLLYFAYNAALTGSPFVLPRSLFDAADHFGFGDGIGFHTRHTLAAGLANTDELLTILQFDLFGWPPLFAMGLVGLVFLVGRARTWDWLAALGFLSFVVAYVGYFYHGIALGPRYYFEALPWLLLLAGRGAQALARFARSRGAAVGVLGVLSLNTLLFYVPAELQRRADLSGLPGGQTVRLGFVDTSLLGPRLSGGVPNPSLVVTDDWWLFNTSLAALNCPRLPDCGVLFALATTPQDIRALQAQYPGRSLLRAVDDAGRVGLVPIQP